MNWCKPHWDQLRAEIEKKGLTQFVSKDTEDFSKRMKSTSDGADGFDALMGCWLQINTAMLESSKLNGRVLKCPLCILVEDGQPDLVANWLDGVTSSCLDHVISKGWLVKN